nr:hypothetical protein [Hymenobacter negativus]
MKTGQAWAGRTEPATVGHHHAQGRGRLDGHTGYDSVLLEQELHNKPTERVPNNNRFGGELRDEISVDLQHVFKAVLSDGRVRVLMAQLCGRRLFMGPVGRVARVAFAFKERLPVIPAS